MDIYEIVAKPNSRVELLFVSLYLYLFDLLSYDAFESLRIQFQLEDYQKMKIQMESVLDQHYKVRILFNTIYLDCD